MPENMDIDRLMWTGYTPTPRVESPEAPTGARQRDLPVTQPFPDTQLPPMVPLFGQRNCPLYQCPSLWAIPLHTAAESCLGFYATEYTVFSLQVPDTRLLMIHEIGYEVPRLLLPIGTVFVVRVRRDGDPIAEWEDQIVSNNANPNERTVFGSAARPIPIKLRAERNQHVTVTIAVLGIFPFVQTPADILNAQFKVLVYGTLDRLRDTRDGPIKLPTTFDQRLGGVTERITDRTDMFLRNWPTLQPYFDSRLDPVENQDEFRDIAEPYNA